MNALASPPRIDLLQIEMLNPQNHIKYSPNLYKWLKNETAINSVPYSAWRCANGYTYIGYSDDASRPSDRYIFGSRLNEVLCNGKKTSRYAYSVAQFGLVEIPEFWKKYAEHGRCAIDPNHATSFINDEQRWFVAGDRSTRSCLWCDSFSQRLHKCTETQIVEREAWVSEPPLRPKAEIV